MPNNRYVLWKEKTMSNAIYRVFRKWQKDLVKILEAQETKSFGDSLKNFLNNIIKQSTDVIINRLKPIINKWAVNKLNPKFKIDWNLRNEPAVRYLQNLEDLYLSNKNWSIAQTTIDDILKIIRNWIDNWLWYWEIGKDIVKTNPFVFSKSRAELIAVTEVWRAYEFWKFQPMKDLQNKGEIVLKKWQTVEDDRVRESHLANQRDWYIPLDVPFSWTGDMYAPAKNKEPYRCRCSCIYLVK